MPQDPIEQLKERFAKPIDAPAKRRIVIWHDADGSFAEAFDELAQNGFGGSRSCQFAKIGDGSQFALKRRLYREETDDDFLLYATYPRNLSAKGLEGNWLADIELIAEHFQADYASLLLDELGATDSAVEGIELFKEFFGAADRKKKFIRLMPNARTKEDVALGVMGTLLGSGDLSTSEIVKSYLLLLAGDENPLDRLAKYHADQPFAAFVKSRIGFEGDLTSMDDIMAHISITALSCTLAAEALQGLEAHLSPSHGQFCRNIIDDWMRDASAKSGLFGLLRRIERACNLEQRFSQLTAQSLAESDVFPCINERILCDLIGSISHGSDRTEEASAIAKRRKDLAWYGRVAPYYDALSAAVDAARFFREHAQGFHHATPADVWKAYTSDWHRMDTYYRRFYKACDACQKSTDDVSSSLDEAREALTSWMERIYTNWFLTDSNACWVNACEKQWFEQGYAEGIDRQRYFFEEKVAAGAGGAKKTLVLISDALRYEVAAELAECLERDTKGTAQLSSMQSVFPSITEFGMAALLPHRSMSFDSATGTVSCNGMPAMNTKDREAVLQARKPNSRALQSKELFSAKRSDRKSLVVDAEIIYVYHNKIDVTGEEFSTEHDVFAACDTAIDDLVALVRISVNDLGISRVLITADHGFIYTRDALKEQSKVSKSDIDTDAIRLGRRYAILDGTQTGDTLFIKMNMDDVAGGSYVGLSPRECVRIKKPGPGESYVHGGASLQEMCVPVIQFRNRRGGSAGYVEQQFAELKLLSTTRRINSMLFRIDLFQPQPVGGKVLPAEYELVMTDASGNEVSNVLKSHADMDTSDESARVRHAQFSLKAGRQYSAKDTYYLLCRKKDTMAITWKEEFKIDIAFAPMDDFGF